MGRERIEKDRKEEGKVERLETGRMKARKKGRLGKRMKDWEREEWTRSTEEE